MIVLNTVADVRGTLAPAQRKGRVAFVPTMGNLHDGHIALMRQGRGHADVVVASIFVNRLQFGPNEDFDRYPRTFEADCAKLADAGVDYVFAPAETDLYPEPQAYVVEPPDIQRQLEGEFRPGHFRGVATVVLKLFNIVQPDVALFGKKDYQQLMVLTNMARQLALPIAILGGETVRASDGLALSSRNGYLSDVERAEAPALQRALKGVAEALRGGNTDWQRLERETKAALDARGWQTDYIAVRRRTDLQSPATPEDLQHTPLVVLGAARLGKTRLIDNLEV